MQPTATPDERAGSPAPDLGQLLGFAVAAQPLADAIGRFEQLGLRDVPAADFVTEPRVVMSDGRISIGLHGGEIDGPMPTFVRPNLQAHVRRLEAAGIELEVVELADDQFHRVSFRDPNGVPLLLLEARTFPPVDTSPQTVPAYGHFAELSIATHALDASMRFWTALGFEPAGESDTPHRSRRLEGHGLVVGLHETGRFRAALTFRAPQLDARIAYLRAKGFELHTESPLTTGSAGSATLFVPGDLRFFLLDELLDAAPPG